MAEGKGEIEKEDNVLVIRRIHVHYRLKVAADKQEAAERAHSLHMASCPVAQTIRDCVQVTTSLEMEVID